MFFTSAKQFSIYYIFFCKAKFIKNLNLIFFLNVKINKYENFKFKKKKKKNYF